MKKKAKHKLFYTVIEKILKVIPKLFILSYIVISLLTLPNCSKQHNDNKTSYDEFARRNRETAQRLVYQNKAELFDCKQIDFILNKTVVADSTIISTLIKDGCYFLKALVHNSCNKNIYTMLNCSEEIFDRYSEIKSNRVFLAAKITKVEKLDPIAEADSLDGKSTFIRGNNSFLLTGECLALAEIPTYPASQ